MGITIEYTEPKKREPVKYIIDDKNTDKEKYMPKPTINGKGIFSSTKKEQNEEAEEPEAEQRKRQIALTTSELVRLQTYLALTESNIDRSISLWNSLIGEAPAAEKNLQFWKDTKTLVDRICRL